MSEVSKDYVHWKPAMLFMILFLIIGLSVGHDIQPASRITNVTMRNVTTTLTVTACVPVLSYSLGIRVEYSTGGFPVANYRVFNFDVQTPQNPPIILSEGTLPSPLTIVSFNTTSDHVLLFIFGQSIYSTWFSVTLNSNSTVYQLLPMNGTIEKLAVGQLVAIITAQQEILLLPLLRVDGRIIV